MNAQIQINGTTYEVMARYTPEDREKDGLVSLATEMRQCTMKAHLYLKRPNGKRMYFTVEGKNGQVSTPVALRLA